MNVIRFIINVHHFGYGNLHTESHLVLRNSRKGFGIFEFLEMLPIYFIDRINGLSFQAAIYTFRIAEEQHRISFRSTLDSLIHRGKESTTPYTLTSVRCL